MLILLAAPLEVHRWKPTLDCATLIEISVAQCSAIERGFPTMLGVVYVDFAIRWNRCHLI